LKQVLSNALGAEVQGQGVASVSAIDREGAAFSYWTPESSEEPAFLVYSITKTFTAALVLQLCEEGALRLEDPLAKWFPSVADAARISVRQLLDHTGGIP
jgi:CubicO group peptidase (beta-lactamase class C family)